MKIIVENGREYEVTGNVAMGAMPWDTYVLLNAMKVDWERPGHLDFESLPQGRRPSQHLSIVLLFWSLFEGLVDRFFMAAMHNLPKRVRTDLLDRYGFIGQRMARLYKIVFGTTMKDDWSGNGYDSTFSHIARVQDARNSFIHNSPESIDDELVYQVVSRLPEVQEAWIRMYNLRCANPMDPPPPVT